MSSPPAPAAPSGAGSSGRNAALVAFAILTSRLAGLVRERVFAHYFGNSAAADAFKAALRIPNLLQNLFGEGVLSASFIPVYARLRAEGREQEAARVGAAIATLLGLLTSVLVLVGILATPLLVDLIAPGFEGEKRDATVRVVRILFPGVGLLVMSAWCLGVLNSHRRFLLPYVAPVLWNAAQIAVMLGAGQVASGYSLAEWVGWGAVLGSALQLGVQLPGALRSLGAFRPALELASTHVRAVGRAFVPVVIGRGVVQISAYIDEVLASFLPTGAIAAMAYSTILYTLPISLFGMAVSAAELPEMASELGAREDVERRLAERITRASERIAYFIVATSAAFLLFGDVIAAVVFQTGRFSHADAVYVWTILGGSTIGLLAVTLGRLYSSAFYALRDTRTPLRFAIVRLVLTTLLGWLGALVLPDVLGVPRTWGASFLAASAGVAGWVEFVLLRRGLSARIGRVPGAAVHVRLWFAALLAGAFGWGIKQWLAGPLTVHPVVLGLALLSVYGAVYIGATYVLRVTVARELLVSITRRLRRPSA